MASAPFFTWLYADLSFPGAAAVVTEEARPEGGRGGRDREAPPDAARRERVRGDGVLLRPLNLDVLEPEVEPEQHGAGVERPLCDGVALLDVGHGESGFAAGVRTRGI